MLDLALARHWPGPSRPGTSRLLWRAVARLHGGHSVRFPIAVTDVNLECLARHPGLVPSGMPASMRSRRRRAATDTDGYRYASDEYRRESHESHEHLQRGEDATISVGHRVHQAPQKRDPFHVRDLKAERASDAIRRKHHRTYGAASSRPKRRPTPPASML